MNVVNGLRATECSQGCKPVGIKHEQKHLPWFRGGVTHGVTEGYPCPRPCLWFGVDVECSLIFLRVCPSRPQCPFCPSSPVAVSSFGSESQRNCIQRDAIAFNIDPQFSNYIIYLQFCTFFFGVSANFARIPFLKLLLSLRIRNMYYKNGGLPQDIAFFGRSKTTVCLDDEQRPVRA